LCILALNWLKLQNIRATNTRKQPWVCTSWLSPKLGQGFDWISQAICMAREHNKLHSRTCELRYSCGLCHEYIEKIMQYGPLTQWQHYSLIMHRPWGQECDYGHQLATGNLWFSTRSCNYTTKKFTPTSENRLTRAKYTEGISKGELWGNLTL
jgi:hypothetical protein